MKKTYFRLLAIVLCAVFAVLLGGCTWKSEKDVIPTEFGTPEGLYLYKGNTRMLTDGSSQEEVLTEAEIDGQTYSSSEFTVYDTSYIPDKHLAYFIVDLNENRYVYLYDYMQKTGKVVNTLPADEKPEVSKSKTNLFVRTESVHILYGAEGVAYEDLDGTLEVDLLYSIKDDCKFEWVYNGEYHCVESEEGIFVEDRMYQTENYVYFYNPGLRYSGFTSVDLSTGEYYRPPLLNDVQSFPYDTAFWLNGKANECTHLANGSLYMLLIFTEDLSDGDSKWHTYLYKVTGGTATVEYYFKNPRWGSSIIGTNDDYIYIKATYNGRGINSYFAYDKHSGETKKISKSRISNSEPPENLIRVGGYEFFTETVEYVVPDDISIFGRYAYCHYLYRRINGKKEIMQYSLSSRYFYDDICAY